MKEVNKKGLCWQAKIARHRFADGKALSCCFCRFEGSILVFMMGRRVGLATVRSEFVSIRFRMAVRRLRGLYWASIVCGTLSF